MKNVRLFVSNVSKDLSQITQNSVIHRLVSLNLPTKKQKNDWVLYRQNCCIPPTRQLQQCPPIDAEKENGATQYRFHRNPKYASCVKDRRIVKY